MTASLSGPQCPIIMNNQAISGPNGVKDPLTPLRNPPLRNSARNQQDPDQPSPRESIALEEQHPYDLPASVTSSCSDRKRKRDRRAQLGQHQIDRAKAPGHPRSQDQDEPVQKRQRLSSENPIAGDTTQNDLSRNNIENSPSKAIQRWIEGETRFGGDFEGKGWEDLKRKESQGSESGVTREESQDSESESGRDLEQASEMYEWLLQKRSTPSGSKNTSGITGVSLREGKNPAVKSPRYVQTLASAGIHLGQPKPQLRATEADVAFCQELLETEQPTPKDSLFNDDLFQTTCEDIANRNEARVIQDIGRLIVPAPEQLFRRGAENFEHLIETVDERWMKSIPLVIGPRPQPDFSVGLRLSAFSPDQLRKLGPGFGGWQTTSRLMALDGMVFPFLTAEVKCGNEALNIADRQNAHSAAVAANAVVELYRLVSRQSELHRKILTFSISHDHQTVRIYGHYAVIDGKDVSFYRHPLRYICFSDPKGDDKWATYKFTLSVYNKFYPIHHERIISAVNQLPDPEAFTVPPRSEQSDSEEIDSQLNTPDSQDTAAQPPSSHSSEPVFKKPRKIGEN